MVPGAVSAAKLDPVLLSHRSWRPEAPEAHRRSSSSKTRAACEIVHKDFNLLDVSMLLVSRRMRGCALQQGWLPAVLSQPTGKIASAFFTPD
jgi:hypothetical protein